LAKATESESVLELISRILNAVCETKELRGQVVAHGGGRELIRIFDKSNEKGGYIFILLSNKTINGFMNSQEELTLPRL
jgi:hypothetical protein